MDYYSYFVSSLPSGLSSALILLSCGAYYYLSQTANTVSGSAMTALATMQDIKEMTPVSSVVFNPLTSIKTMLVIDSITSAVDLTLSFFGIKERNEDNVLKRYFYYLLMTCCQFFLNFLFYNYFSSFLLKSSYFLALPWVYSMVKETQIYRQVSDKVFIFCHKQFKRTLASLFAALLNFICLLALNIDPEISRTEISSIIGESELDYILTFVKILIFSVIIKGIAKKKYMLPMLKTLFNQGKFVDKIVCQYRTIYPEIKNPVDKIRMIINHRKFEEFFNPTIMLSLLEIYEDRQQGSLIPYLISQFAYLSELTSFFTSVLVLGFFFPPSPYGPHGPYGPYGPHSPYGHKFMLPTMAVFNIFLFFLAGKLDRKRVSLGVFGYLVSCFYLVPGLMITNYGEIIDNNTTRGLLSIVETKMWKYLHTLKTLIPSILDLLNICIQMILVTSFYGMSNVFFTIGMGYLAFETINRYFSSYFSDGDFFDGDNQFINWMLIMVGGAFSGYDLQHLASLIVALTLLWMFCKDVKIPAHTINIQVIEKYNDDNDNQILEPLRPKRLIKNNPILNFDGDEKKKRPYQPLRKDEGNIIPGNGDASSQTQTCSQPAEKMTEMKSGPPGKSFQQMNKSAQRINKSVEQINRSLSLQQTRRKKTDEDKLMLESIRNQLTVETMMTDFETVSVANDTEHTDDTSVRKLHQDGICIRHDYYA